MAQNLIDARLPQRNSTDEVIVLRSDRLVASDAAFATPDELTVRLRRDGGVERVATYLEPGGEILVSADRHATLLPVVLAHPQGRASR